jgi:hypothetical protein
MPHARSQPCTCVHAHVRHSLSRSLKLTHTHARYARTHARTRRVPFRGAPRIVDLTTDSKLAARVVEARVEVAEAEREEVLYYLLAR